MSKANKLIVLSKSSEACLDVINKLDESNITYKLLNPEEAFIANLGFHEMSFPVTILLDHNNIQLDFAIGFDEPVIDRILSQL